MIKCLLFDCDGVLVDSEPLSSQALVFKFRELGIELSAGDLTTQYRGWELERMLDKLAREHQIILPDDFVVSYRQNAAELFTRKLRPIIGIADTLAQLNHPKAVVSSGPMAKIRHSLRISDLEHHFENNIYSAYDIGIWKPDPGLYQYAAREMGFAATECAVIEDSAVGLEAGVKAGMQTFFYNYFNEPCYFEEVISFNTMAELPELIKCY